DFEPLYAAASDPLIWEQHPDPLRYQRDRFETDFFAGAVASKSAFVVTDNATGKVIGSSRYYEWNPTTQEVAIGYSFLARSHWGGAFNRDMKQLMLRHAFCWAKVVWFHIGQTTGAPGRPSKRSVLNIPMERSKPFMVSSIPMPTTGSINPQ